MDVNMEILLILAAFLVASDIVLVCSLMISRIKKKEKQNDSKDYRTLLNEIAAGKEVNIKHKIPADDYFKLKQVVQLDRTKRLAIEKAINAEWEEKNNIKKLNSGNKLQRLKAIVALGFLGTENARRALEKMLLSEKDYSVKIYIANALSDIGNSESIPVLTASLINAHRFYRSKVNMLITDFGESFNSYIPVIRNSRQFEIKELLIDYAGIYFSDNTKYFLLDFIDHRVEEIESLPEYYRSQSKCCKNCVNPARINDKLYCKYHGEVTFDYYCRRYKVLPASINPAENYMRLVYKACEVLSTFYPQVMVEERYFNSKDLEIKKYAIKALANIRGEERIEKLLSVLGEEETAGTAGNTISLIIERNPGVIFQIADAFHKESEEIRKKQLAKILSARIEYFILKLEKHEKEEAGSIIKDIILEERTSEIIDFLNNNKNIDIENELLAVVIEAVAKKENLKKEFTKYLEDRVLKKCGWTRETEPAGSRIEKRNKWTTISLYLLLAFSILLTPLVYLVRYWERLLQWTFLEHLERFVIDFNYYLAFYSIAINLIYLILLLLSQRYAKRQEKLWKLKNMSLLFKKRMLPSVSIIAPAYNEETTIIESANSLLNLKYPDYELIIINDGSKDNTLNSLIQHFNLKRIDYIYHDRLQAKSVRGIYLNRSLPKLIVVDKENGGKADSLNVGINIANKEYFCGIDADSLLEDEALLRLAALTLDEAAETPAMGGNVLPINGCTVEQGQIIDFNIPGNRLARLQTIEYIRAFMAGRLGWAKLNSLLIISGAFGLFRKERVISVGGYLTSSGKYEKDTVGEDMELVVRIRRLMRELGLKYRILYSYNANCWTEVPESLKILKKQRYRWHKGLIDILTFHKKMIFNPQYGRTGLIAMPYFFFFEMIGPMLEFQGYLMVVIALILGLLNLQTLLLLFICTVLLGILISVSSLVIAERDMRSFKLKDIMILIGYAIIENFGPRQYISFWRVGGYFQMLRKPGGWDKAERKGFTKLNK